MSKKRLVGKINLFAAVGFFVAILVSLSLSAFFPKDIMIEDNLWFGADIKRVILYMTDPSFSHDRTSTHPLFPLLILPLGWPISAVAELIGFGHRLAQGISAQLIISLSAGVTWLFVYIISINFGLSVLISFALGLLFLTSSSFIFWWSAPESFAIGSFTVLLPFLLLSLKIESRKSWIVSLILSVSITITNFAAGLIALYCRFKSKRFFLKWSAIAISCTLVLSIVQRSYFPTAKLLFQVERSESKHVQMEFEPAKDLYSFFVVPFVAPAVPKLVTEEIIYGQNISDNSVKGYQQLDFGIPLVEGFSLFRMFVASVWVLFFINGIFNALFLKPNIVCKGLILFLVFQLLLHSFYGDSPFLYSAHFVPVTILIGGYGLVGHRQFVRSFSLFFILILALFSAVLNLSSLFQSFDVASLYMSLKS